MRLRLLLSPSGEVASVVCDAPKRVFLPVLGERFVCVALNEPSHYLWLSAFGWHDCTPEEDKKIYAQVSNP
jgi:hypothetical protein